MITKRIEFILVSLVALATLSCPAWAEMTILGYEPSNHYRFYSWWDPPKDFIGEGYDWSGVGISSECNWATMISPQYFLTSRHNDTDGTDETITFYSTNVSSSALPPYEIDNWSKVIGGSDLCLRRLTQPISEEIAFYPIHNEYRHLATYTGDIFFAYGVLHRVGRNVIDSLDTVTEGSATGETMYYEYDTQGSPVGPDECILRGGDSGGPSFLIHEGELSLVGIHWLEYDNDKGSADTLVPFYFDEIRSYVNGGDANKDGIVNDIDATIMAANWGKADATWEQGDFDGNGLVDEVDAERMASNWHMPTTWLRSVGLSTTPAITCSTVPEPTTGIFILLGMLFAATVYSRRGKKA